MNPPVVQSDPRPQKSPDKRDELRLLVNSRHPLIAVETHEEVRVEELLDEVAAEMGVPLFVWSVTTGLVRKPAAQPLYQTEQPSRRWPTSP